MASGTDSELACGSWDVRLGKVDRLNSNSIVRADARWNGFVRVRTFYGRSTCRVSCVRAESD